jgi:hypothetical protein
VPAAEVTAGPARATRARRPLDLRQDERVVADADAPAFGATAWDTRVSHATQNSLPSGSSITM